MSFSKGDVYGGNYPKAKRIAFARSKGMCQFCGLRQAEEGHHWAFHDYPSASRVKGDDLTALCKTCHQITTTMRDWIMRKSADLDFLKKELEQCTNFTQKREAISYWFYPEAEDDKHPDYFDLPEPLERYHFVTEQVNSIEIPEFVDMEPQVTATEPIVPAKSKDQVVSDLLEVFFGPAVLIMLVFLLYAFSNW